MDSISVGPFGGEGGIPWDDETYTTVRRLRITWGLIIDSIQIEYDKNGQSEWSTRHGGGGGSQLDEVKLDYPDEYLTSVSGYYTSPSTLIVIASLKFHSNRSTYGPFGSEQGRYFSFPSTGGKIIGFHGNSGRFLDSIGAHFDIAFRSSIGPLGGLGGNLWDDGKHSGVRQIVICFGSLIDSICIEYDDNGHSVWSSRHGGSGKDNIVKVKLEYPDEYLTSISGYYRSSSNPVVIQSLTIQSDKRLYGPFGMEKGNYFSVSSPGGKIIGFHGKDGQYLDSIGAYMEPISMTLGFVGPFGGDGGESWDDGNHNAIRQIRIIFGSVIHNISVQYNENRRSIWYPRRGGDGGSSYTVTLDLPDEYLISVSGHYLALDHGCVSSLTFQSNKRTFGPIGNERGKYFSFPSFSSKIVGFHGRCGNVLHSIGAHVEPISISYQPYFMRPFGGQGGEIWDDGIYTTIRKLEITYKLEIESIRIEYDKNGHSVVSRWHGSNFEGRLFTVKFDYPNEFIISLSGFKSEESTYSIIRSLTIQTNKKTYGPVGIEKGDYFSIPVASAGACGKIVGFHGKSGACLDAIGAYIEPVPVLYLYESLGPFGGPGGHLWDDGIYTAIRQIEITYGDNIIYSIHIEYDKHGRSVWSKKHGECEKGKKSTVELDYPGEFIVLISGHYKTTDLSVVCSLKIESNKKIYGPFGTEEGNCFSFPLSGSKIVGFFGRCGNYLDSIGAYVVPLSNSYPSEFLEPFGGQGGSPWDDGVHDTVRSILIGEADCGIEYICFEYDKQGRSVLSQGHGKKDDNQHTQIKLDYPGEFLVSISGFYSAASSISTIQSLTFQSNKRTFGPFGQRRGIPFSLQETNGKIVGFHGRSSKCIDSIGVYLRPISHQ